MKIKHITGEETNTDQLPDCEAMALEKVEDLRLFCLNNKIPFVLFISSKGSYQGKFLSFWNFSNRDVEYKEGDRIDLAPVLSCINTYVRNITNGQIGLAHLQSDKE
jgi:hypothetical protein